jgi:Putative intracellular protease/amidase
MFLLKRFDDRWLIISKTADSAESNRSGKRVLLVVSDAPFHGTSQYPAGVSFEEAFRSYKVFRREGYTVDILSPGGGPVPLAYIDMSNSEHRSYIYDSDFLSKLEHTLAPAEVDPSRYRAIQFIGGSNAMYRVAENAEIQAIAMAIHDDHGGVISAVCHGTAGLMALKTASGEPFIKGRKITGFPREHEKAGAPYLAHFPFMIDAAAGQRGAEFSFRPRGTSYVVADDRLITGQNPESSEALAEAVVKRLRETSEIRP